MDAKQRWIVVLSLLVCGVGIINAQLMAVTERFREIGTMKCLGALDRFILRLFLLEAGIQGLIGASAGATLGVLTALATAAVRYGWAAAPAIAAPVVAPALLGATLVGFLLSICGALYPAWIASRMQPVAAMRAEH
jgi:ABC-type antimicrobial peptide transport system permease subunit